MKRQAMLRFMIGIAIALWFPLLSVQAQDATIPAVQASTPVAVPVVAVPSEAPNLSSSLDTADRFFQQGIDYYQANQLEEAIAAWETALNLYQTLTATDQERRTLSNIGAAYLALGNYGEAVRWLQQVQALPSTQANPNTQAQTLGNLGIAYRGLGRYEDAIAVNSAAIDLMRQLGNRQGEGQLLSNLGNIYEAVGDYENAIATYQQSLDIARQLADTLGEAIVLANLGAVQASAGNHTEAIALYEENLALLVRLGDPLSEAHTRLNLASAYYATGRNDLALYNYQLSYDLAQHVGDRPLVGKALNGLGMLAARRGDFELAIAHQQESVAIARTTDDLRDLAITLNNLGHTFFKADQLSEAEETLREAIALWDQLRSESLSDPYAVSLFDTQVFSYNLLKQVLVARGQIGEALEVAEQGRARALVASLSRQQSHDNVTSSENEAPTLDQIRKVARTYNATLVEYSIIPEDDFYFQGKQRGGEQELLIWVVQPNGSIDLRRVDLTVLRQEAHPNLTALVSFVRLRIGARGNNAEQPSSPEMDEAEEIRRVAGHLRRMHELLIEPIADLLPENPDHRVIFIPHETLFLVPFPALQDARGAYLIEQHTLITAPAIQVLALQVNAEAAQPSVPSPYSSDDIFIVGNPTMPFVRSRNNEMRQLAPLPGSEREAIAIGQFFNTEPLLGDAATESAVIAELPRHRIIHLATHGLLDYVEYDDRSTASQPSSSPPPTDTATNLPRISRSLLSPGAIAFAPSEQEDGLFTAEEIRQQRINAELVVLSACDTGRGEITGDGVVGLSRSFLVAGADSLVVSLWAVPDAPTATVMTEFYRHLQAGDDRAQALRQAMLSSMAQYALPLDWAAFTLVGIP